MSAAAGPGAEQAGRRVEEVLDRLAASGNQEACEAAEELVRVLMDFYGAGLARITTLLGQVPPAALERLLRDELVSGMLVLHDLHPEPTAVRITRALESLPGRPVELVAFDPDTGALRVRSADAGGCGCPSTNATARQAVEDALSCFATEVSSVELEAAAKEPTLLQISPRPAPVGAA
ncbi:NifU family protein [Kitasatospora kazusensis]|uniref:NifU family protein n=1 Tax=Kitasatospora kazusensis TaxID=407974 RepID=A0ABN1ZKH3_9ACTN